MSNMSYCRFRNTEGDLDDCLEALEYGDGGLSSEEFRAATRMLTRVAEYLLDNGIVSGVQGEGAALDREKLARILESQRDDDEDEEE